MEAQKVYRGRVCHLCRCRSGPLGADCGAGSGSALGAFAEESGLPLLRASSFCGAEPTNSLGQGALIVLNRRSLKDVEIEEETSMRLV